MPPVSPSEGAQAAFRRRGHSTNPPLLKADTRPAGEPWAAPLTVDNGDYPLLFGMAPGPRPKDRNQTRATGRIAPVPEADSHISPEIAILLFTDCTIRAISTSLQYVLPYFVQLMARYKLRVKELTHMTTEYLFERELEHVIAALMPQNQLIVRLMLHTGMRLSDALCLKTQDLSSSGWYTEGKTKKRRRYGIPRPLLDEIREQAGKEWAFPGRRYGTHKTRQAVWKDIKRASIAFRLPQNVGAHSMRKVYAVELMKKYGNLERVQKNLNHAYSSVTAIYAMSDMLLERKLKARERRRAKRQ